MGIVFSQNAAVSGVQALEALRGLREALVGGLGLFLGLPGELIGKVKNVGKNKVQYLLKRLSAMRKPVMLNPDRKIRHEILSIGASTGGYTDCLLQRGAKRDYAIDVGYGQLDYKLRQDPRVAVMERVNAHYPFSLPEKVNMATMDLSFISVNKVIPNILAHLTQPGYIIVLFKPQFEAERNEVGKGGVIKDPQLHARVLGRFIVWATDNDLRLRGLVASPILGAEGNKEFLILLTPSRIR